MPPKITPHHARLEALFEVSRALNSSLELREALVIVIDAAIRLTGAERGFLMLVDEAAGQFQFQVARNARLESIDESAFEVSRTVVQEVAETGAPVVTLNAQKDPRFGGKTSVVNYYLRSIMAVPLRARGRLLGVLYVDSKTRDMEFRQGDLDLLTTFADQAATALVNAQLYEAQRQDANLRRLLLEVADAAQAANDVLDLAHRLAQQLPAWMQCDRCALFLTEAETGGLRLVSAAPDTVRQILIQPVGEPAGAWPFQARLRASPGPLQFTLSELIEALPAEWLSRLALQGDVLAVPLRAETQLLGVLAVDNALAPRPFTPVGLALAEMLGPQLAAAIQRLQLFETARRQLSELLILNAAAQAASQAASLDELTAQVMEVLNPVFGTQGLGVLLIDETAGGLRLHRSFDPEASPEIVIPLARGIAGAVVASGRPIRLGDVTQDPRYLALNPATRSELCVPLRAGERVIGVLNVESPQAHAFSAADERLLVTVAGQLATAIAKQRLLETERQQRELAEALSAVGLELTLETELEVMLDRLLGHIARVVPFDAACVLLVEGDMTRTAGLRGYHRFGLDVDAYVRRQQLAISATTNLRQMAESGLPLVITDVRQNTGWVQTPALPHLHAWVGAPVMVGTRCLAFLSLDKMEGNFYRAEHAQRLAAFAGYAGLALQNVRLLQSAERRAAELDAVRTASLSLTSSLDVREVLQAVLRGTLALLPGAHDARIFFYQAERLEFGAALRADGRPDAAPPPRPRGLTREVAITGELRVVPDIRTHPLFIDAPHEWRGALIGLPLKIGARVVGVMNVAYPEPRAIGEAELRILRLLGEQAAAAIENARLFAATRRQVDELTMLHAVAVASSESISLDMLLERITDLVGGALNARYYGVWLVDGTGLLLRPHTSYRGARQAAVLMGEGLIGRAASAGLPQHAPDVAAEPAYQAVHSGVRSQMCMPLKIDAQVAGVIDLESDRREAFTEADQRLLATVAGQLSIAIAKTRLLEAERAAREQAETLREVAGLLNTTLEREALLNQILEQLGRLMRYDSASIMLLEDDQLQLVAQRGFRVAAQHLDPLQLNRLEHIQTVLDDRQPLMIADTASDHRWRVLNGTEYIRCWLGVPLVVKGRSIGILNLDSSQPGFYTTHDADVAQALANQAAAALDRLQLWEETEQRGRELAILLDVARAVSSSLDLNQVLDQVGASVTQTLRVDACALSSYDPVERTVNGLRWHTVHEPAHGQRRQGSFRLADYPLTAQVIAQDDVAVVSAADPQSDPRERDFLAQTGYGTLLMLTVRASGRPVGLMEIFTADPGRQFGEADLRLARAIADQTGVALENARLFQAEREQRQLAEALRQAAASLGASLDFDAVLDQMLDQISSVVPYDAANLMLVDVLTERARVVRHRGYERLGPAALTALAGFQPLIAETFTLQRMLETGRAFLVPDVAAFPEWVTVERLQHVRSWVGVPVIAQGMVLAFVSLDKTEPGFYQPKHAERLTAFAGQVALALQNARLYETERRRVTTLTTLHDVALELGTRRALPALWEAILAGALRLLEAPAGALYLLEAQALTLVSQRDLAGTAPAAAPGVELARRVAETGETLVAGLGAGPQLGAAGSQLGVPLHWQGQLLGVLVVQAERPERFGEADVDVLRLYADRAAIAYENVRLVDALEREKQRLELLVALSQSLASTLDPDEVALRAMDLMRTATGAARAAMYVGDPGGSGLRLRQLSGYVGLQASDLDFRVQAGQGVVSHAAETRRPVAVPDVALEPRWTHFSQLDDGAQSAVMVPLLAGDALVGVVSLLGDRLHFYQEEHLPLLRAAAVPVALALQNAGLFEAEARRVHYLTVLNEITRSAVTIDQLPALLQALVDCLGELTGADACYLTLWDDNRQHPVPAAAYGPLRDVYVREYGARPGQPTLTETVLRTGQALIVPDLHTSPYADPPLSDSLPRQSQLVLPLVAGDQRLGAAIVAFHSPHHFSTEEVQHGEQAAGQIALALARARLFDATRRHADELSIASDLLRQLSIAPQILGQFPALAAGLKQLAGCQYALMALLAPDGQVLRLVGIDEAPAAVGGVPHLPLAGGLVAAEVLAGRPHFVTRLSEAAAGLDQYLAGWGVQAHLTLPLRAGQNVIGLLTLLWTGTVEPARLNLALFNQIVDALALAVEKDRLLEETLRRAAELEAIAGVSEALRGVGSAEAILDILVERTLTVLAAEAGAILTPTADGAQLDYALQRGLPAGVATTPLPLEGSIAGQVFRTGQAYLSPDLIHDPLAHPAAVGSLRIADPRRRTALYAPLRSGPDIIGVMVINASGPRQFGDADRRLINTLAEIGGNALQRARVLETLEQRVAERTRELARANAQLQELDQLKDQFVSNVSHELRTPLTAIKLHLGLLEKRGAEALPRYLPVLQRETERLRRLIEDLLDLSRLRARSTPLQRELHRLDTLMAHVLALYSTRAEEREVVLHHLVNAGIPLVPVDQAQLTQVFANLIANAVTYTVRGGRVTVSSGLESSGVLEGVAVRIHNDGPPIPAQDLPHLFTRFYRGQTARESGEPGTGLGLAICKEIIERHGGYMDVASGEGQGTTFTIWLPLTASVPRAE